MGFNEDYEVAILKLVNLGKDKGYVTERDIKKIIPKHVLDVVFDSILVTLQEQDIYIID